MKAILTLLFVLIIGVTANAQNVSADVKAETIQTTIVTSTSYENVTKENTIEVARLYKFKNSRIKRALSFTTKKNKAKMA